MHRYLLTLMIFLTALVQANEKGRSIEINLEALASLEIPLIDFTDGTTVAEAVQFLNLRFRESGPQSPKWWRTQTKLSDKAMKTLVPIKGKNMKLHRVIALIADAVDAEVVITRKGYIIRQVTKKVEQNNVDPFAETDPPNPSSKRPENKVSPKALTRFSCSHSGSLSGKALDNRVESIVLAISKFHEVHKKVPNGIVDLEVFCREHKMNLLDLKTLSAVKFKDGQFSYTSKYGAGTLHLTHQPGMYFRGDDLIKLNIEQDKPNQSTPQK